MENQIYVSYIASYTCQSVCFTFVCLSRNIHMFNAFSYFYFALTMELLETNSFIAVLAIWNLCFLNKYRSFMMFIICQDYFI